MPKFVSGSSGHIYAHNKSGKGSDDEEEDVTLLVNSTDNNKGSISKPSAVNKKGSKEKQKNSLDLFKDELRRLHEERDEQRNKLKKSFKVANVPTTTSQTSSQNSQQPPPPSTPQAPKPQLVPVPLKPDPRCPTTLTLQVNLNPKDRESSFGGSFDNGDPATTNIYLGNVNPAVNENDLCDIFGKFGPLASIKIMWPRTDEERARNRNSGFVAYMSRIDAERALRALNGKEFRGYDMKLVGGPYQQNPNEGWGKAVPIPQNPVYVPPELVKLTQPPPQSGLPFNGQLHESDVKRGYVVPNPYPRPLPPELDTQIDQNPELKAMKEAYEEFIGVVERSTVRVILPNDRCLLDKIHKTIEYVIKDGPVFEAIIIASEKNNPAYRFLYDNQSPEHVYYRWKLYSILHGDDPYEWRTEEFRMFEGGPVWKPPSLNPYADGMPEELIGNIDETLVGGLDKSVTKKPFSERSLDYLTSTNDSRIKGTLGKVKRDLLGDLLRNLDPTKKKIGDSMMFCINHADAAIEIIDCIYESLQLLETPFQKKIARLYLVSDILNNCSATVTNASYYRKGFQSKLISIFEHLREYLINIEDRYKADKFKQKVLAVLGAWKEWTLYEDEFVIRLSNILLGIKEKMEIDVETQQQTSSLEKEKPSIAVESTEPPKSTEEDLDGLEIDDETLGKCLEAKGLSLRWYKTLDLSEDEEGQSDDEGDFSPSGSYRSPSFAPSSSKDTAADRICFKTSKWETVDPNEVAEQVVTMSKWEAMAREEEEAAASASSSGSDGDDDDDGDKPSIYVDDTKSPAKKFKSSEQGLSSSRLE